MRPLRVNIEPRYSGHLGIKSYPGYEVTSERGDLFLVLTQPHAMEATLLYGLLVPGGAPPSINLHEAIEGPGAPSPLARAALRMLRLVLDHHGFIRLRMELTAPTSESPGDRHVIALRNLAKYGFKLDRLGLGFGAGTTVPAFLLVMP